MVKNLTAGIGIILLALALPASANDSIASVTPAGIRFVKTDAIRMKKEVLSISPEKVVVEYEFYNDSDKPLTLPVSFPMPPIGDNMYDNQNVFPDFSVTVDGKAQRYKIEHAAAQETVHTTVLNPHDVRTTYTEKDITADLKALDVPLDRFLPAKELPPATLKKLVSKGYYSDENPDEELNATYMLRTVYWWQQSFPPRQTVRIAHGYTPSLGGNSVGRTTYDKKWEKIAPTLQEQWMSCYARPDLIEKDTRSPEDYRKEQACLSQMKAQGMTPGKYWAKHMKYILSTGANWKHGIEDFTLRIEGAAVIFAEVEGEPYAGVGSLDIHKTNFHPTKELAIEFIGSGQPAYIPPFMELPTVQK